MKEDNLFYRWFWSKQWFRAMTWGVLLPIFIGLLIVLFLPYEFSFFNKNGKIEVDSFLQKIILPLFATVSLAYWNIRTDYLNKWKHATELFNRIQERAIDKTITKYDLENLYNCLCTDLLRWGIWRDYSFYGILYTTLDRALVEMKEEKPDLYEDYYGLLKSDGLYVGEAEEIIDEYHGFVYAKLKENRNATSTEKTKTFGRLKKATDEFLLKEKELLEIDVNERSMTHKLAEYIQKEFTEWNIDCEYNRLRDGTKALPSPDSKDLDTGDKEGRTIYPDIICHRRNQVGHNNNLFVIECKKKNNKHPNKDVIKLEGLTLGNTDYSYQFGLLITFENYGIINLQLFTNGRKEEQVYSIEDCIRRFDV